MERPAGGGRRPGRHLAAGLVQHPGAERDDEPGLLGQREELQRGHHAAVGMLPPHQRLDAGDRPVAEVDHRLIGDAQLPALDGVRQLVAERESGAGAIVQHRRVVRRAPLAECLAWYIAMSALRRSRVTSSSSPNAMPMLADVRTVSPPTVTGWASASCTRSAALRALVGRRALEQHRELITAESGDGVALTEGLLEAPRDLDEQRVAGRMAEAVVDRLEVVEIDEEHRRPAVPRRHGRAGTGHRIVERDAIEQPGQRVERRPVRVQGRERLQQVDHHDGVQRPRLVAHEQVVVAEAARPLERYAPRGDKVGGGRQDDRRMVGEQARDRPMRVQRAAKAQAPGDLGMEPPARDEPGRPAGLDHHDARDIGPLAEQHLDVVARHRRRDDRRRDQQIGQGVLARLRASDLRFGLHNSVTRRVGREPTGRSPSVHISSTAGPNRPARVSCGRCSARTRAPSAAPRTRG